MSNNNKDYNGLIQTYKETEPLHLSAAQDLDQS